MKNKISKNNKNIDINLIDFAFLSEKNNIDNDLVSSMKKFIVILDEFQQSNFIGREYKDL